MHTFPDLKHNENTSKQTFGRASNITPITPKGTAFLDKCNPLLNVLLSSILPMGEGRLITFLISETIPRIRSSVSFILSYLGLSLSILCRSFKFSERM